MSMRCGKRPGFDFAAAPSYGARMKRSLSVLVVIVLSLATTRAGVFDFIKKTVGDTNSSSTSSPSLAGFSQDQLADALKQALGKGVSTAITNLGQSGGFLNNPKVKIP